MRKIAWVIALLCNVVAVVVAALGFKLVGTLAGSGNDAMASGMGVMIGVVPMIYALALSIIPTCAALCVEFISRD
jgi:uncharacterized protein YqgC (DUF456 family)